MAISAEMLEIAMAQSALEAGCEAGDFMKETNVVAASKRNPGA
jgi:hypothetical protein